MVVDDAYQKVNLVTRGEDLLPATHIQRLLQALLKLPEPAYAHHPLVLDAQGRAIPGLYVAGNDMQSVMGGAYPGPGITLGPALTFGWIAGRALAADD